MKPTALVDVNVAVAEQLERQDRLLRPGLDERERHQEDDAQHGQRR